MLLEPDPMNYQQAILAFLATGVVYVAFKALTFFYGQWTSPLRVLPGPKSASLIYGNMKQISDAVKHLCCYRQWPS